MQKLNIFVENILTVVFSCLKMRIFVLLIYKHFIVENNVCKWDKI